MNSSAITDQFIHCLTTDPLDCLSEWTSGWAYFAVFVILTLLTIYARSVCQRRNKELSTEITKPLSNSIIKEGETVEFTCEVSNYGATVKWFLDGKAVDDDERYETLSYRNVRKLKIKDAVLTDAGEIMAKVEDTYTNAKLAVEEVPTEFVTTLIEQHVEEHKTCYFTCGVNKDNVTVTWYKDEQQIKPSDKHFMKDDCKSHTLVIMDVEKADMAEYTVVVGDKKSAAKLYLDETKKGKGIKVDKQDKKKPRPVSEIEEKTVREIKGPWKEKLLQGYKSLVQDMDPETVVDDCFTEGIITNEERDRIMTYRTPSDKIRHFLKILLHKSEDTYNRFLECLTDSHTKKFILEIDVTRPLRHENKNVMELRRKIYCNLQAIVDGPELKYITDDLISERIFEIEDLEKITNDNLTTKQQNTNFLNCLLKTKTNGFHLLVSELKQTHPDVANTIETTNVTEDIDKDIEAHLRIVELEEKGENLTKEEKERIKMNLHPEEISTDKLKTWQVDDETFCATKATEFIFKTVKNKGYLISGLPGAGKTANVKHVALQLKRDGYRLCCVDGIKELIDKIGKFETGEKQIYVIDDVFGVHGINDDTVILWTEKHKDDIKRCLDEPNILLLCSSRVQVLNDQKLSNIIKLYFTVINISEEEAKLPSDVRSKERVEIFRKHASTKKRGDFLKDEFHLKKEIENKIKQIECPAGCFPLICRLYVGDKETDQTIENYFNKPLDQIHEHIQSLQNSPIEDLKLGYFCLLMCMIYDNKVPVKTMEVGKEEQETKNKRHELLELCEIRSTFRPTIKKKMDTLLHTFLKIEDGTYRFLHDIIHDAVIKHVSGLSSSAHTVVLRHCSSKFIRNRVHLSGVDCKDWWGDSGHDTESCINIKRDVFSVWASRVLDIVRDGVHTSDQFYNDIHEGRCSIYDRRGWDDNSWRDVFYNPCVRYSSDGQKAIAKALAGKSPFELQTIMCTKGYSLWGDTQRHAALHWAMSQGLIHIITQTVSMISQAQQLKIDSIRDVLCWAIDVRYDTDVIQALIDGGLDVNTSDVDGDTPLCEAVSYRDYKITKLLLDKGANVNQCDKDGESALYMSQLRGYDTITELLQLRGAVCIYDGEQYNHVTDTPDITLCDCIDFNNYQAVKILIERGVDVNKCDKWGQSALYRLQLEGVNDIIELLQSRGAVCIYKGKQYRNITDIPDSEVDNEWVLGRIQELKQKQKVNKFLPRENNYIYST